MILVVFDLLGTFVFATSGAVVAARKNLDVFGALVLSFAAGTAGGIARDVLIGATPPIALKDGRYLVAAVLATAIAVVSPGIFERLNRPITILDAFGLALFGVTGTWRALDAGAGTVAAVLLGILTGVGGGVVRDVLVARVPVVFTREIYALAAALASGIVIIFELFDTSRAVSGTIAVVVAAGLRVTASYRGWHLPRLRAPSPDP